VVTLASSPAEGGLPEEVPGPSARVACAKRRLTFVAGNRGTSRSHGWQRHGIQQQHKPLSSEPPEQSRRITVELQTAADGRRILAVAQQFAPPRHGGPEAFVCRRTLASNLCGDVYVDRTPLPHRTASVGVSGHSCFTPRPKIVRTHATAARQSASACPTSFLPLQLNRMPDRTVHPDADAIANPTRRCAAHAARVDPKDVAFRPSGSPSLVPRSIGNPGLARRTMAEPKLLAAEGRSRIGLRVGEGGRSPVRLGVV